MISWIPLNLQTKIVTFKNLCLKINTGDNCILVVLMPFKNRRNNYGNILILSLAGALGLLLVLGFFVVNYNRFQGTVQMQSSAIEAAALTASGDLSRIVYNDPHFGYVALSDHPPIAPNSINPSMLAGDGYPLPVQSINVLVGTLNLDSQIINSMSSSLNTTTLSYMNQLINADYTNLQQTVHNLTNLLNSAVSGTVCTDWYGNSVNLIPDAQNAYNNNLGNGMTQGGISTPAKLSFKLGYLNKVIPTNIPTPNNYYNYVSTGSPQYCYFANQSYAINGLNLAFSAIGNNVELVNSNDFSLSPLITSPTIVPTVLKVSVNQPINITNSTSNTSNTTSNTSTTLTSTIHKEACAIPYNQLDPRPNPGSITFRMPQGVLPNNISPLTIMNNNTNITYPIGTGGNGGKPGANFPQNQDYTPTSSTSLGGPASALANVPIPNSTATAVSTGIYHWLRNAGVKPVLNNAGLTGLPSVIASSGTNDLSNFISSLFFIEPALAQAKSVINNLISTDTLVNTLPKSFTIPPQVIIRQIGTQQNPNYTNKLYDKWYPTIYGLSFDNVGRVVFEQGQSLTATTSSNSIVNANQMLYWGPQFTAFTPQQLVLGQGVQILPGVVAGSEQLAMLAPGGLLASNSGPSPAVNTVETTNSDTKFYTPWLQTLINDASKSLSLSGSFGHSPGESWNYLNSQTISWQSQNNLSIPFSNWSTFDSTIRDNSFTQGSINGGLHGGQPNLTGLPVNTRVTVANPNNLIRPSYLNNGTVADFRFFTTRNFAGDVSGYLVKINQPSLTNPNN